jgi:8-oxo-dGTP diphosphatase
LIYSYPYPHPALTTDIAVFTLREGRLCILLIERAEDPHAGAWALPGGFLRMDETLDACARRELLEETGVEASVLFPFANYSEPDRDPRERVISAAYLALMPFDRMSPRADSDATAFRWADLDDLPPLAFDHANIVEGAQKALRSRCEAFDILFGLLPAKFTLSAFQAAYEAVMGEPADRRNLHKAVLTSGLVTDTSETSRGRHRPARLFCAAGGEKMTA